MTALTLRNAKGSALTWAELDANFSALKTTADAAAQMTTDGAGNTLPLFQSSYNYAGANGRVSTISYSVNPPANSTYVYTGDRIAMNWSTAFSLGVGGWVSTTERILNFPTGTINVDKALVQLNQININAAGNINALLGFESEIATVNAGATVGSYAAFYVPNLSGVANIGNITNFYSFACDHVNSKHKNAGVYVNAGLIEYAPPNHPGIVPGRYYSAPHDTIAANSVLANTIYLVPVHIPQRTLLTKLGLTVTTLVAGGSARLALYRAQNGVPTYLIVDAGVVSTATTGDKEATISQLVESGEYFLAVNFSAACSVNWHQGGQAARQGIYGSSTSSLSAGAQEGAGYIPSVTFGAFPSTAGSMTYSVIQAEPHLWFRA